MNSRRLLVFAVASILAGCSHSRNAAVPLAPVPYDMLVPAEILPRLTCGSIEGPFAAEVAAAGAIASTTVHYSPTDQGDKVILLNAYLFPAARYDELQSPDSPPPFGFEVLRADGKVLSIAGPIDAMFAPDTPDGKNLTELAAAIYLPATYRAAK